MNRTLKLTTAIVLVTCFGTPGYAQTASVESYVQQLLDQGYTNIEISTTFLGRTRIEAYRGSLERELIVARNGAILRDDTEESDDEDDDEDDEDDDDLDDDDDDDLDDDDVDDDDDDDDEDEDDEDDDEDDDDNDEDN
jgi:hypothetical protein